MNIFISNLSWGVNDNDLRDLFTEYGEISSAKVITDKMTGRSRGFGFVEMPNEEEAKKAIDELNQEDRPSGGFNRGGGYNRGGGFNRGGGERRGGFGGGERRY